VEVKHVMIFAVFVTDQECLQVLVIVQETN